MTRSSVDPSCADELVAQFIDAYQQMAKEARYRPAAPRRRQGGRVHRQDDPVCPGEDRPQLARPNAGGRLVVGAEDSHRRCPEDAHDARL